MSDIQIVDGVFKTADRLGSLPTASILAIFCMAMGYYIYRNQKADKEETLVRLKAWESATLAEEHQTATIAKIVETIVSLTMAHNALSEKVTRTLTIIEERFPKGDKRCSDG